MFAKFQKPGGRCGILPANGNSLANNLQLKGKNVPTD